MSIIDVDDNSIFFNCPHCNGPVLVSKSEINCKIFRHGIYKSTNEAVDPHLTKAKCEDLVQKDLVYGCCKPFRLNLEKKEVEICDYI